MDLIKATKEAFFKAIDRAGGRLIRLQEKTGVDYPTINRLNSGKRKFKDLSLQTFEKLFPEMEITFFRDERQTAAPSGLTAAEHKIIKFMRELDEEGQLDLLVEAAALRERRSKKESRQKMAKAG